MRRDWWLVLAGIGAALTCRTCLTRLGVLAPAIGLGAWTGHLAVIPLPLFLGFVLLGVYRY